MAYKNLGSSFKKLRVQAGYSQKDFSNIVVQPRLSLFENDQCSISTEALLTMLEQMHIRPAIFFRGGSSDVIENATDKVFASGEALSDSEFFENFRADIVNSPDLNPNQKKLLTESLKPLRNYCANRMTTHCKSRYLSRYFSAPEEPTPLELTVFTNTIYAYDAEILVTWYNLLIAEFDSKKNRLAKKGTAFSISCIIFKLLGLGEEQLARKFYDKFTQIPDYNSYIAIEVIELFLLLDAVFLYHDGKSQEAQQKLQDTIQMMTLCSGEPGRLAAEHLANKITKIEDRNATKIMKNYSHYKTFLLLAPMEYFL